MPAEAGAAPPRLHRRKPRHGKMHDFPKPTEMEVVRSVQALLSTPHPPIWKIPQSTLMPAHAGEYMGQHRVGLEFTFAGTGSVCRPQGCPTEKAFFLREEEPRHCWRCSGPSLANTGWLFPGMALAVAPEPFPRGALTPASPHLCSEEERLVKGGSTHTEERPEPHRTEHLSWSEHQGFFSGPPPSRVASFPTFPGTACKRPHVTFSHVNLPPSCSSISYRCCASPWGIKHRGWVSACLPSLLSRQSVLQHRWSRDGHLGVRAQSMSAVGTQVCCWPRAERRGLERVPPVSSVGQVSSFGTVLFGAALGLGRSMGY